MPTEREIEAAKQAIKEQRRIMYDAVVEATNGSAPSSASNFLNKYMRDDIAEAFAKAALEAAEAVRQDGWQPIETALKDEKLFLIRHKDKPHVQHEAMIFRDRESWEIPEEYDVLYDVTLDDVIDGDWSDIEWQPLPQPPKDGE